MAVDCHQSMPCECRQLRRPVVNATAQRSAWPMVGSSWRLPRSRGPPRQRLRRRCRGLFAVSIFD